VAALAGPRRRRIAKTVAVREGSALTDWCCPLFVTERTVEAHVTQVFTKLELSGSSGQHRRVPAVLAFLRA
jgi:DNA-binding NarL/FixJ family response regulator